MTHAFLPAFLHSLARRVALRPLSSSVADSLPRRFAPRSAALLLACAALGCGGAALPLAAQARIKATHPSVNVTTVLPQSVMVGLQRAHVPLSSNSVVVVKVGDRTPILA